MGTTTLEAHEVFSFLRPDQIRAVSETSEPLDFSAGNTVYRKGELAVYLYVILSGQVSLRLPGQKGVSVLVDELGEGAMFGSCVCLDLDTYSVTAQCTEESRLLKVEAQVLKKLMDEDLQMGYALQKMISKTYFKRYIDSVGKLQTLVMNLPLEPV
jgi:CRP-like cAMP-binding protein